MNYVGALLGLMAFVIIGVFHPIVIKTEYYIGKKAWPVFLLCGIALIISSLFVANMVLASILGIIGFSSLWSIHELIEQENRVKRGWFPRNPNKKSD